MWALCKWSKQQLLRPCSIRQFDFLIKSLHSDGCICGLCVSKDRAKKKKIQMQSEATDFTDHACQVYPLISLTGRHSFAPESKAYPTHSGSAMHLASMHARSQDSIPIVPSASAPAHRAELPVTEPCWPLVAHSLLDASGRG